MDDEPSNAGSCPRDVLRLIAWYPDGDLSPRERASVEAHAALCRDCRDEIAMVGGTEPATFGEAEIESLPAAEGLYAAVAARIEEHSESERAERAEQGALRALQVERRWSQLTGALAAGLAALVVGVGFGVTIDRDRAFGLGDASQAEVRYQTATEADGAAPPQAGPAGGAAVDVIFRSNATADEIAHALRALEARIVSGPTRIGVFRLRLRPDGDPAAAVEVLRARGSGVATFAELVHPTP